MAQPTEQRFSGFADMGNAFRREETEARERKFETFLKGRLADVPVGNYESRLAGVSSLTLSHPLPEYASQVLNATLFFAQENGREGHVTVTVNDRGMLGGDRLPRELSSLKKEAVVDELLRVAEAIDPRFWETASEGIIPESDEGTRSAGSAETAAPDTDDSPERRDVPTGRLEYMRSQEGVLFGITGSEGFHGYRGSVFPGFIVLECEERGNAAFVVDVPTLERLTAEQRESLDNWHELDKPARVAIADAVWNPVAEAAKTRGQLVSAFGAERITHQGKEETWKGKLADAITRRRSSAPTP